MTRILPRGQVPPSFIARRSVPYFQVVRALAWNHNVPWIFLPSSRSASCHPRNCFPPPSHSPRTPAALSSHLSSFREQQNLNTGPAVHHHHHARAAGACFLIVRPSKYHLHGAPSSDLHAPNRVPAGSHFAWPTRATQVFFIPPTSDPILRPFRPRALRTASARTLSRVAGALQAAGERAR